MGSDSEKRSQIIRETCVQCALKHVGQAHVLLYEKDQGYPRHFFFALAHLAEASDELIQLFPEWAERVRSQRKMLEADPDYKADLGALIEDLADFDRQYAEEQAKELI